MDNKQLPPGRRRFLPTTAVSLAAPSAGHRLIFLLAILLLALALRLAPWGDNRFLEDEAPAWRFMVLPGN